MPYKVKLPPVVRGDNCEQAIALTWAGPPVGGKPGPRVPMPATAVTQLQAAYPLIEAQFKVNDTDSVALISLSSAQGDIRIEAAYPLPDGTTGPAVILRFQTAHTHAVFDSAVWDMQFSGPGMGPQTWVYGDGFSVTQDVTRTAVDPP